MRALITGISGQDGSYLADFLLERQYKVFGLVRRCPDSLTNISHILNEVEFLYGDLQDASSLACAIGKAWPDEIYNLAAQSFVPTSWSLPYETLNVNTGGLARILAITLGTKPDTKVYQASSSEMFGNHTGCLDETSPMLPTSPYGTSKLAAHHLISNYRQKGLRAVSGILFNHESERRGQEMVTMKICQHLARFHYGQKEILKLGNLAARRDWGYAPDYVRAMFLMLYNAEKDYVIGTEETHSVDDFLNVALKSAGIPVDEFREKWLESDSKLVRTGEINQLCAKATKAHNELGWWPKVSFEQMVCRMVESQLRKVHP